MSTTQTRRRFLAAAGAGAGVVVIGTAVLPIADLVASAQEATAKLDDAAIAAFLESVELAAVDAYKSVAGAPAFVAHHTEHAKAIAAIAGSKALGRPNAKLTDVVRGQLEDAKLAGGQLKVIFDLENALAATYLYALGAMTSKSNRKMVASILPVESEHAAALGRQIGRPLADAVPDYETQALAIDISKFPTVSTTTTAP